MSDEQEVEVDTQQVGLLLQLEEKLRGHPKLDALYKWVLNELSLHNDALTPAQEEAIAEEATGQGQEAD